MSDLTPYVIAVWMFALGGVIGSFLNVVVYRLPEGMSLIEPGSHCPKCKKPIRWYDNVPIFGWLWLRGRCRDCGVWISPRYPLVEAVTAGLFLLLMVVECLGDGMNLPARAVELPDAVVLPARAAPQLYWIAAYHLALLTTLLTAALIEYDGQPMPWQLFVPALTAGLATVVWPYLHPVAAFAMAEAWWTGLVDCLAGAAAGALLGGAAWWPLAPRRRLGFLLAATCVGLFLGWQAVLLLAPLALGVHLLLSRLPAVGILAACTLGWIMVWDWLVDLIAAS